MNTHRHYELNLGMRFQLKGVEFEVVYILRGSLRYASTTGGQQFHMDVEKFHTLVELGELVLLNTPNDGQISLIDAPTKLRVIRYVDAALKELKHPTVPRLLKPLIENVSRQINDKAPPGATTLARWIKKYRDNNNNVDILLKNKGNRSSRFSIDIELLINEAIEQVYLASEHRDAKDVLAYIVGKQYEKGFLNENLSKVKIPSIRTIQRKISRIDPYTLSKHKDGQLKAVVKLKLQVGR
jgi:putative transposase